jgi:hypothetical protein
MNEQRELFEADEHGARVLAAVASYNRQHRRGKRSVNARYCSDPDNGIPGATSSIVGSLDRAGNRFGASQGQDTPYGVVKRCNLRLKKPASDAKRFFPGFDNAIIAQEV